MVPLVGERLVDLLEEGQSSMIPAPYIGFRHSVPRPVEASAPLLSTGFPKYTHVQSGTRERARAEAFFRKHGIELDPAYLLDGGAAPSGLGGIGPLVTWGWAPQANQILPLRGIQGAAFEDPLYSDIFEPALGRIRDRTSVPAYLATGAVQDYLNPSGRN